MANAADIIVNLVAKTGRFERGMDRGRKKMDRFKRKARELAATINRVGGRIALLGGAAAALGFARLVTSAIQANDELGKMATTLGIAVDRLRGMQLAAELAGIKTTAFNKGVTKLGKAVVDAANGLETYKRIFDRLNISTEELLELSPDEQILKIGKELSKLTSVTERTAAAADLFGARNVAMVNLLANSTDAIEETIDRARLLGAALEGADVAAFEVAQDNLTLMRVSLEGIRNSMTIGVLPVIQLVSDAMQQVAEETTAAKNESRGLSVGFLQTLGGLVSIFKTLQAVAALVGLITAKLVGGLADNITLIDKGFRALLNFRTGFRTIANESSGFGEGLKDASEEFAGSMSQILLDFEGIEGESAAFIANLLKAQERANASADAIQKQREELQRTSAELARIIQQRAKDAAAEVAEKSRLAELERIIGSTLSAGLKITADIAKINAAILLSRASTANTEAEVNRLLAARAILVGKLIEAEQKDAGIVTAQDRAKKIASIVQSTTKQSVLIARNLAVIIQAQVDGEGDRNDLLRARKALIEDLIAAQKQEQEQVSELTEIGLQTLRNMTDALADFFAGAGGGFKDILRSFTDMLRKMVAQLLARQVLLSFLGLFAGGTSSTALFAQQAISGIKSNQRGGPLAAGQASIVGEAGPELFIPKSSGQVIPNGALGSIQVNITQRNSFAGSGPLEPATLIPILEENNRKLKAEFVDELRRGAFA